MTKEELDAIEAALKPRATPEQKAQAIEATTERLVARFVGRHTPGPWTWHRLINEDTGEPLQGDALKTYIAGCVERGGPDFFAVMCEKPDGPADVCHTGNGPTSAANARLIAAAPELLAALHEALFHWSRPDAHGDPSSKWRALIAKAEGR